MDPFIEGRLWSDFHSSYMVALKRQIIPRLPDNIIVNVETTMMTDELAIGKIKTYKPDASIYAKDDDLLQEPEEAYGNVTPATLIASAPVPAEFKQLSLMIYDEQNGQLVAAIEMLSPANKRPPNLNKYQQKRAKYLSQGIHLLELDLLRAGKRPYYPATWPEKHYAVQLVNGISREVALWAISIQEQLPTVNVPLLEGIPGLKVNLQETFADTYAFSSYDKTLAYDEPLPGPALNTETAQFIKDCLSDYQTTRLQG